MSLLPLLYSPLSLLPLRDRIRHKASHQNNGIVRITRSPEITSLICAAAVTAAAAAFVNTSYCILYGNPEIKNVLLLFYVD